MKPFNQNLGGWITALMLTICIFSVSSVQAQQKNSDKDKALHLTFNAEGKLLGGYLPRYNPLLKDKCKNDRTLSVRVHIPLDYFDETKAEIDLMAAGALRAVYDKKNIIYKILNCEEGNVLANIERAVKNDKDVSQWNGADSIGIIPKELPGYAAFIKAFGELKDTAKHVVTAAINQLNKNDYMQYAPFRLKVKGLQIADRSCIKFELGNGENDPCQCVKPEQQYVVLRFDVPPGLLLTDITVDSFQLIRKFTMKEVAIKWYNKLLKDKKADILGLQLFESRVKATLDTLTLLLAGIDSLKAQEVFCTTDLMRTQFETEMSKRICLYKKVSDAAFGRIDCKNECGNILLCSKVLREWVARLIWLNGDKLRLNPFRFTNSRNVVSQQNEAIAKRNTEVSLKDQKNAAIKTEFSKIILGRLQDSVLKAKGLGIDSSIKLLDKILEYSNEADSIMQKAKKVVLPAADVNEKELLNFLTTSQVNYKGWLVPYKSKRNNPAYSSDKQWLRNYYLNEMPNPLRHKLHYTYPEDENITLLLHNVPPGTAVSVTERTSAFADSAAFTVAAGELVTQVANLYTSLGTVAGPVKAALALLNKQPDANEKNLPPPPPDAKTIADQPISFQINGSKITTKKESDPFSKLSNIPIDSFEAQVFNKNVNMATINADKVNPDIQKAIAAIKSIKDKLPKEQQKEVMTKVIYTPVKIKPVDIKDKNKKECESILYKSLQQVSKGTLIWKSSDTVIRKKIPAFKTKSERQLFARKFVNDYYPEYKLTPSINPICTLAASDTSPCYMAYMNALFQLGGAPALIDEPLKARGDTTPLYQTVKYGLNDADAPYKQEYELKVAGQTIDKSYIKAGKYRYLQTAAGIAYTPGAGFITSVDTSNGGFAINRDDDHFRLIGGLRWYPFGLYNQKNPVGLFRELRWIHRLSLLVAVSVPKPLQNIYLGGGFEIVPGLNFSVGTHLQQQNRYTIQGNQVKERSINYRGHFFYAVTIDPNLLINAVNNLIKK